MLTAEENRTLTLTGPDSAMGNVLRCYWMPAMLTRELPERDGPPLRVRLLGEDFIAFRDSEGRIGIVEPQCPHRGANLYFGRLQSHNADVRRGNDADWQLKLAGADAFYVNCRL